MIQLSAAWLWTKEHAALVASIAVSIIGFILGGLFVASMRRPDKTIKKQLDVLDAGKQAAETAVTHGADFAVASLELQHDETIAALDDGQKQKAAELKQNPRELARFLTNLSNKD